TQGPRKDRVWFGVRAAWRADYSPVRLNREIPTSWNVDDELFEIQQLYIEHQHALRSAGTRRIVIGEVAGNPEPAFLTDHHELHPFRPTFDNAVEWKGYRLAAYGTVEHLAVGGPSRVVDGHLRRALGMILALARNQDLRCEAG